MPEFDLNEYTPANQASRPGSTVERGSNRKRISKLLPSTRKGPDGISEYCRKLSEQ